jgi:hypothetical protein
MTPWGIDPVTFRFVAQWSGAIVHRRDFSEYCGYLDNVISTMLRNLSSDYQRLYIIEVIDTINYEVVQKMSLKLECRTQSACSTVVRR